MPPAHVAVKGAAAFEQAREARSWVGRIRMRPRRIRQSEKDLLTTYNPQDDSTSPTPLYDQTGYAPPTSGDAVDFGSD